MKPIHAIGMFLAYLMAARLGLSLTTVSGFATAIWPATGVAIIGILLGCLLHETSPKNRLNKVCLGIFF
jgi:uncharacterized membrane protein YvlD (DUF360 family)